jgi:hypothetical protein
MPASAFSPQLPSLIVRPRLVPSRTIGTIGQTLRLQGERPFEQVVAEAFDGPVLRLSQRIKVLEVAEQRHIRRGDALDVIETVQRELEQKHDLRPPCRTCVFLKRFGIFAAVYVVVAMTWCMLI